MKLSKLKTYAPKARRDFIAAVTDRAALLGITPKHIADVQEGADVVVIEGKPWPKAVGVQRQALIEQIEDHGFDAVMEQAAYSWFNRMVALRFMELHQYLDHGYQVLGNPDDAPGESTLTPEILGQIEHIDLPGLKRDEVINLKLENKDEELYRLVLIAQCNALHTAIPFLFEKLGDATELLLPDHLLRPGSILRELITAAPDEDWQQVEIIGWLYQFYISERKDEVMGKTVKTEDIPAATQLFTPNWIVQYLVQNSLGRQWLDANPDSNLTKQMPYYIKPAEQEPEVQAKLDALKPDKLDPESLTLLDPACGSGHILVEAYDLFKAMYLERGYRPREIPELILRHNLFGLEIDPRAAQLAGFALLMKACADDPRILRRGDAKTGGVWMNVRCIQSSDGLDAQAVYEALTGEEDHTEPPTGEFEFMEEARAPLLAEARRAKGTQQTDSDFGFTIDDVRLLLSLFKGDDAQTFGSLIHVPTGLVRKLSNLVGRADHVRHVDDMHRTPLAERFFAIAEQASMLSTRYSAVVANPPYMGGKALNPKLKHFAKDAYPDSKSDLFAMFIQRGFDLARHGTGHNAMVTMQSWMFLSSYENMRKYLLNHHSLETMLHMDNGVMRIAFGTAATCFRCGQYGDLIGTFSYCTLSDIGDNHVPREFPVKNKRLTTCRHSDFQRMPGSPIAYWFSKSALSLFDNSSLLCEESAVKTGMTTGDNASFVRAWQEVSISKVGIGMLSADEAVESRKKWFPYNKGGGYRKWFGFNEYLIDWENDGERVKEFVDSKGKKKASVRAESFYFRPAVTYSAVTSGNFSARVSDSGCLFDSGGSSVFPTGAISLELIGGLLCSNIPAYFLAAYNDTINFQPGDIGRIPVPGISGSTVTCIAEVVNRCIDLSRMDYDAYELSRGFQVNPMLSQHGDNLASAYKEWLTQCESNIQAMKKFEEENNQLFVREYGLQDELLSTVPIEHITLLANPAYRYPTKRKRDEDTAALRPKSEREVFFREDTAKELISYVVGCMMGRYSLDEPGLIYAHASNEGFDPGLYKTFPADADGIIPITDTDWFDDDAANRLIGFIATAWPKKSLEENLLWLAQSIDPKGKKPARETLRGYLADPKKGFFDHHLGMYKKRPIYWMLTSGKLGAFQALVYLHRYHAGTLARVRSEYVLPLMGKIDSHIQRLDKAAKPSTADRKQIDALRKQLEELRGFDERLHHLADQRIELDLDDGVKVNYGKFSAPGGDIFARVKDVVGKKGD